MLLKIAFPFQFYCQSFFNKQSLTLQCYRLSLTALTTFLAALGLTAAGRPSRPSNKIRARQQDDFWGGALSLGPTTSHILSASTILIPGTAPSTQLGYLFLWPGISNGTGDLVQTTIESWPESDGVYGNAWCGATVGEWCLQTGVFGAFGQISGELAPAVSADTQVLISYTSTDNEGLEWSQTASNAETGEVLSQLTFGSGPMTGWGTATECDNDCDGTIAEQQYLSTTITLAASDPGFVDTLALIEGATYTGLSFSSDSTVLTIESILIPAMNPT